MSACLTKMVNNTSNMRPISKAPLIMKFLLCERSYHKELVLFGEGLKNNEQFKGRVNGICSIEPLVFVYFLHLTFPALCNRIRLDAIKGHKMVENVFQTL